MLDSPSPSFIRFLLISVLVDLNYVRKSSSINESTVKWQTRKGLLHCYIIREIYIYILVILSNA